MNIFKEMPVKYRLLFIIFLPAVFLMWTVWSDYKLLQNENRVQLVMEVAQKISFLATHVEAVSGVSKTFLVTKGASVNKGMQEFRAKVDKDLAGLQEMSTSPVYESIFLKETLQPLFTKANAMTSLRSQIDSHSLSYNDVDAIYDDYLKIAIHALNTLSDQVGNSLSMRTLFEMVNLIEQRLLAGKERSILYRAFQEDAMSAESYIEFLQVLGMQEGVKIAYHDIATLEDDRLYTSTFERDSVAEAQRLQKVVVTAGTNGKFGISPTEWWEKQTAKMNLLEEIQNKIFERGDAVLKKLSSDHYRELFIRILLVMATLSLSFLLILFNLRSLARKLQAEINILSTAGEEIGRSISETASGTSETAAAVAETTTTVEELKQTAQVATEKTKNVAEVSDEALKTLKHSEKSVQATIQGMNGIQEGMELISESIVKLSEHSQMIREIIDTVNDLAEQSHILAVNAAIESAKAGDQGKGFAVVAQEVRSLAEQSKQATIQVRNILNDVQNATSSAVMATEKGSKAVSNGLALSIETKESIHFLSAGINKVAQAASQISLSSQQQLIGVDQLTIAMSNIKIASDQQVDNMAQIEIGMQGLNAVGRSLKQVIHECKI